MGEIAALDLVLGTILALAALRGLFLGLVREAFSLAALCAAYFAARLFAEPAVPWVEALSGGRLGPGLAPWVARAAVAFAALTAVVLAGRLLRRGVRAVGLSWADRLGGGLLGAAEGAVVAAILLVVATSVLGREHAWLAGTRSLAALENLESLAGSEPPAVAAPPRAR